MRGIISMLSLMFFISGFAQDTLQSQRNDQAVQPVQFSFSTSGEPLSYTLNDEEFRFIPEDMGFRIVRIENGAEVDYGSLRQTTDDGYFVMTSKLNDHVSYGRFDEKGNFNALRLDEETDHVVEENFRIASSGRKN